MALPVSTKTGARAWLARLGVPGLLAVTVSAIGLVLRLEHALTFDGPARGSDYGVYVHGIRWMLDHHRPFGFDPSVHYQVRYQPPLWYALGALILHVCKSERAVAGLSIMGWIIRQLLLARILREAAPECKWSALCALSLHALLPLSVLIDGKVNPEGPHATLFMCALYVLWRIERQAAEPGGICMRAAVLFAIVAGLALLTKATSATLMLAAALVLAWHAARALPHEGWSTTWRRLMRPALVSAAIWCLVVGFWCGPNVQKYGHPFPHIWDVSKKELTVIYPVLSRPIWHRRSLGWILPSELTLMSFPVIESPTEPPPNFWAATIAGTWADIYNRGFCRLRGGGSTDRVWGGDAGFMSEWGGGEAWSVSFRCIRLFAALARLGACITLASIAAVIHTAWDHVRTGGRRGSLVLPTVIGLGTFFVMLFALAYPLDDSAVLNPRYLLPVATPMAACAGLALARMETPQHRPGAMHMLSLAAIGIVGALLLFERFGS